MRRQGAPLYGKRYCANINSKEVHDLDNEQTNCQINEIIAANNAVGYDYLSTAHTNGHNDCYWCLGSK